MRRKKVDAMAIKSFALLAVLGVAFLSAECDATAQDAKTAYPSMAATEQYLMERNAEIALARTAAPESISSDAEVLVLGRHGFETAMKGKNGFVCLVERSWTSTADPDFWNPKVRTPICWNAEAARTVLRRNMKRTELILAGRPKEQVDEAIVAAVEKKELPAPESGAMCYMMSKEGYGGDTVDHWPSHLMFYFSEQDPAMWGANLASSPIIAVSDAREHVTTFVIVLHRWSDGTEYHEGTATHRH